MEAVHLSGSLHSGFQIFFYILVITFMVHAVILMYHWKNFGDSKKVTTGALAVYLCGGALLFLALALSIFNL